MKRCSSLPRLLLALVLLALALPSQAQKRSYTRLVIFSDLHLPGRLGRGGKTLLGRIRQPYVPPLDPGT